MWFCPCSSAEGADPGNGKDKPLERLFKKVIKNLGPAGRISEEEMIAAWEDAAGVRAAKHSRPVALRKGELVVNVDGSSWLYELTTRKKEVLGRLAAKLENKKLKNIRFRIGELK